MLSKNTSCHFERSEKSRSGLCLRLARDPCFSLRLYYLLENCKICAEISPVTQREKLLSPRWRFSSTAVTFAFHRGGVSLSPRWHIYFTAVTEIKVTTHFAKRNVRSRQKFLGKFSITKQGANSAWAPFPFLTIRAITGRPPSTILSCRESNFTPPI